MVVLRTKKDTSMNSESEGDFLQSSPFMTTHQETHLITGGGGHAGFCLGKRLAAGGHKVILADLKEPIWIMKPGMEFCEVRQS